MSDTLIGGFMVDLPGMLTAWNKTWEEAPRFAPGMAALGLVLLYIGSLLAQGPRDAARRSFGCRKAKEHQDNVDQGARLYDTPHFEARGGHNL